MKDEKDIQPSIIPIHPASATEDGAKDNPVLNNGDKREATTSASVVPVYKDLHADRRSTTCTREAAAMYSANLPGAPGFPWSRAEKKMKKPTVLPAPYLTGANPAGVTEDELIAGIYIHIPRSRELWTNDQLKLHWGYNTYCSVITAPKGRDGPRQTQYLNSEALADYKSGVVEVHYEVFRGHQMIAMSETLKVHLSSGKKSRNRVINGRRATRHRKLPE